MKSNLIKILVFLLFSVFIYSCFNSDETDKEKTDKTTKIEEVKTLEETDKTKDDLSISTIILIIIVTLILGPGTILFFYTFVPLGLWYEAWLSGVKVSWLLLIKMRWQKIPQDLILRTMIKAKNAGQELNARDLVGHYLAEVNIETVVNTLIRAQNASLDIPLNDLAAQFLAKVDVEKVIATLITAKNADLDITITQLASHYLADVDIEKVVDSLITSHNSGHDEMTLDDLKEHYLAGGDVIKTVAAYVAAKKAKLPDFEFDDIASIDLSGIDVTKAIKSAITPRVVETDGVTGFAKDGIQLTMKLKLTLRAYIPNIIGGAKEETVLARVNEALVTTIGQSDTHYDVLENPYELADKVEKLNHSEGTAFEILSVDVSDISVGKDIHSELKLERAHAEAEMAKADVIRAEEKVQKAMAAAFIDGNLSIQGYHKMMNTEADTKMRESLGKTVKKKDIDEHH